MQQDKIAILINSLGLGGAERVVSVLLQELGKKNYPVDVIFLEPDRFYALLPTQTIYNIGTQVGSTGFLPTRIFRQASMLRNLVNENHYQAVLSFLHRSDYINIMAKLFGAKHRAVICLRNSLSLYSVRSLKGFVNRLLMFLLYPFSDTHCYQTERARGEYRWTRRKAAITHVIPNPFDLNAIEHLAKTRDPLKFPRPFFSSMGRLMPQKRLDLLLKAFSICVATDSSFPDLVIIGDGPERDRLREMAQRLAVLDRVTFTGTLSNPFGTLSHARFYVLSSEVEGFPNALVEALACGVPVIASDCPAGPREILEPHGPEESGEAYIICTWGLLFRNRDGMALARAMLAMNQNSEMRNRFAEKGKLRAADFSPGLVADRFLDMIRETIARE